MTSHAPVVENRPAENRFVCVVDGITNEAAYRLQADRIVMHHTWVDPSLQGRGIAAALAAAAMQYARDHHLKVVASCSYIDAYMRRKPELADLRA
jgi:uncharacterized protein